MPFVATDRYLLMKRNNALESTSSSSDELNAILRNRDREKRKLRARTVDYESVINSYSDEEFKRHFRLSRNTFNYLHGLIQEDLVRRVPGCPTIPSHHQLMIALWKMATTDSYRSVCDRFNVGRATAVRAVRRVCHALFIRTSRFIQWPTEDHAVDVMRGFEKSRSSRKLASPYSGLMVVNTVLSNDRYIVNDMAGSHRLNRKPAYEKVVAADGMRPWIPVGGVSSGESEESSDEEGVVLSDPDEPDVSHREVRNHEVPVRNGTNKLYLSHMDQLPSTSRANVDCSLRSDCDGDVSCSDSSDDGNVDLQNSFVINDKFPINSVVKELIVAQIKCNRAKDRDDLSSSSDESALGKGMRFKKSRIPSDYDCSLDEADEYRVMPPIPILDGKPRNEICQKGKTSDSRRLQEVYSTEHEHLIEETLNKKNQKLVSDQSDKEFRKEFQEIHSRIECVTSALTQLIIENEEFPRQVMRQFHIINARRKEVLENLEVVMKSNTNINNDTSASHEFNEQVEKIMNIFPIRNLNDINKTEEILKNPQQMNIIAKELSRLGGGTVKEITKRIMFSIINNETAQLYSWEGQKGKQKFKDLLLGKLIINVQRSSLTEDSGNAGQLYLLPITLPPTTRSVVKVSVGIKRTKRFTIKNSQLSIINIHPTALNYIL
ncbi:hypothetical protein RN001_005591 [Aquatica leii]|uniref:DUF4806 domain-containing protein n=1 Tax=Aquatica leii TaxID=1421715 RepID=A0AAN7SHX3_9COLE|nr:hypothetical protein RN001_005591 [Aquatica leii]